MKLQLLKYLKNHGISPSIYSNPIRFIVNKPNEKQETIKVDIKTHSREGKNIQSHSTYQSSREAHPKHHRSY